MSNQLSSGGVCASCGAPLQSDAKFCTACGAAVGMVSARPRQPAVSSPNRWPLLVAATALVLLAISAVMLLNKPKAVTLPANSAALSVITAAADAPYPDVARITAEDAHARMAEGQAVLLDVRDRQYYDAGHASGSLSMPESELPGRLAELPRDKMIITYCT